MKPFLIKAFKIMLVILGIVFFPFGFFLLGYIIGSKQNKHKFVEKKENEAVLTENIVSEEKIVL